jgi:hypothetical protein
MLAAAPPASAATTITVTCTGPVTFYEPVGASYQLEFGPECKKTDSTRDGVINSRSQGLDADEAGFFSIPEEPDSGGNLWYAYAYYYEEWNGKTVPLTTTLEGTSLDGQATLAAGDTVAWTMGPR